MVPIMPGNIEPTTGVRRAPTDAWRGALPLLATGAAAIVAGGLLAAAVAPAPTRSLVWLAAYLVLVVGVIQIALAAGQAQLAGRTAGSARLRLEWALFNLGSIGVMAGTVTGLTLPVALGTVALLGALLVFWLAVRRAPAAGARRAYQGLVMLVTLSACVGLYLSVSR